MSRAGMAYRSWSSTVTSARMPGSRRPATSSEWLTQATPAVKASMASWTVIACSGWNGSVHSGSPRRPSAVGQDPVHRDVDLLQRIGAGHRPVAAERDPRALPDQRADLVLPGGALGADEGDGQLFHLRVRGGPQRLEVGDRAERGEPAQVPRGDELQVRQVVARGLALRGRERLDHVKRGADGVIADGVEVQLESSRGQPLGCFPQHLRIDEQAPLVAGGMPLPVQVRGRHRGGERLAHAVQHQLDRGRPELASAELASAELATLNWPALNWPALACSRRASRSSIWPRPRFRSHHRAPTTWQLSMP